jgi:hypothetical protein
MTENFAESGDFHVTFKFLAFDSKLFFRIMYYEFSSVDGDVLVKITASFVGRVA